MRNYAKTIIYTIQCKDPNITETYASYTTNLISRRRDHKSECNNPNDSNYNSYHYRFIRENGGWDNWEVICQYNYPCENKAQSILEKKRFIIKNNCNLNTNDWFYIKEPEIQIKDLTEEDIVNQIKELEKRLEKERARHRVENMTLDEIKKKNDKAQIYRLNNKEEILVKQTETRKNMNQEHKEIAIAQNKKYKDKRKATYNVKYLIIDWGPRII